MAFPGIKDISASIIAAVESVMVAAKDAEKKEETCEACAPCNSEDDKGDAVKKQEVANAQSGLPELGESVASSEPDSAVTMREVGSETPKHVDVVSDIAIVDGEKKESFRLLMHYPSGKSVFVPEAGLPGAPDLDTLLALSPDMDEAKKAILKAKAPAHVDLHFSGK